MARQTCREADPGAGTTIRRTLPVQLGPRSRATRPARPAGSRARAPARRRDTRGVTAARDSLVTTLDIEHLFGLVSAGNEQAFASGVPPADDDPAA